MTQKERVLPDPDIFMNSENGIETRVKLGSGLVYQKFWSDKVQKHNRKFARKYGKMDGLVVYYDL